MKRILLWFFLLLLSGCLNGNRDAIVPENPINKDITAAQDKIQGSATVIKEVVTQYPDNENRDQIIIGEADSILEITGPLSEQERKIINERIQKVIQKNQELKNTYETLKRDNASLKQSIISQVAQHEQKIKELERKAKLEREQARKDAFVEKCLTIGGLFIVGGGIGFIQAFIVGFSRMYGLASQQFGVQICFWPYLLDVAWFIPALAIIVVVQVAYVVRGLFKYKQSEDAWQKKYEQEQKEHDVTLETLKSTVNAIEEWKGLANQDKEALLITLSKKMDADEKLLVKEIKKESI